MYTGYNSSNAKLNMLFEKRYGKLVSKRAQFNIDNLTINILDYRFETKDIIFNDLIIMSDYKFPWKTYGFTTDIFFRVHQFQKSLGILNIGCYSHLNRYCENLPYKDKVYSYIADVNKDDSKELAMVVDKDIMERKMNGIDNEYKELIRSLISTDDKYRLVLLSDLDDFLLYGNNDERILKNTSYGITKHMKTDFVTLEIPNVFDSLLDYKGELIY